MDWWIAFWTACLCVSTLILGIVTAALAVIARRQLINGRHEAKGWQTLSVCSKYDHDPMIERWIRSVRAAQSNGTFAGNEAKFKLDIYPILNYFESIAIGIHQNIYLESIAYDQLYPIFVDYVDEFLNATLARKLDSNYSGAYVVA